VKSWLWTMILPTSFSQIAWDVRYMPLHPAIGWDRIFGTFCLGWPQTLNLWISVSQVVTDMNHWGYPVLKELF
jgi:hypothetical protein